MLEKPNLQDQRIIACMQGEYGLRVKTLTFLPLGADVNTAVFRMVTDNETAYFLKLRKGAFHEISVAVPLFLKAQGLEAIITPLETMTHQGWANLDEFKVILYPFIEGQDGYQKKLSEPKWQIFGAALRAIHSAVLPSDLSRLIPREAYASDGRELVLKFQAQVETESFQEQWAVKLAAFMKSRRKDIDYIVQRAGELAQALQTRSLETVLCHSDLHPGNLLLSADGALYIVDWDDLIYAPKEQDLALVGGWPVSDEAREISLFYQGYGQVEIEPIALVYYRYERIIQDIAAFCQQLLMTDEGGEDRAQAYEWFTSQFRPQQEFEIAVKTDECFNNTHAKLNLPKGS
jgi:spectinomycin phosphotransferase